MLRSRNAVVFELIGLRALRLPHPRKRLGHRGFGQWTKRALIAAAMARSLLTF
jgi:hypothetical protein